MEVGIISAFVGMLITLFITLGLARRVDHAWKLVRRAAGHKQERGALERIFVVALIIVGSAFLVWFLIISGPGSSWAVPAQRAPSPVPDSSLTTKTSTGPSSALVPELQVSVALASRCAGSSTRTTPKSLMLQPGLIGHGRYVGKSPAVESAWAKAAYDG